MRISVILFTTLGLVLSVAACSTRFAGPRAGSPSITLERTGCLGPCPIYTLTLYADGYVQFEGRNFVRKQGVFTKRVSREAATAVFQKVEQIGFWAFKEKYRESEVSSQGGETLVKLPPTDMPTRYVSVKTAGSSKKVEDYWGAPDSLHELEDLIDTTTGAAEWVGPR